MSSNKDIEDQRVRMDPMILQQIKKMGISEKRELLERLKALIAKEMAGSALADPRGARGANRSVSIARATARMASRDGSVACAARPSL